MTNIMGRMAAPIVVIAGAILAMLVLAGSPAHAAHGGEIPTYGEGTDCVLVNFSYDDGDTDHFYACGALKKNDLTRDDIPELHVTELHVSCSDVFPDGEFEKGDPTGPGGEIHTVDRYRIVHYKDFGTETQEIEKQCGEEFVPLTVDVCVDLVNDASGDGAYSDDETADAEGADVPERVTVTNCGDEPHVIDEVTIDGEAVCPDLLGMVQQPGESETCDLVQPGHTPAEGEVETDTVEVLVSHPDDPETTATDSDPTAMTVRAVDNQVGAGNEEPDSQPATDREPESGPTVAADELPATGARAELGFTGLTSMALGLLLLLGATAIVRQVRYARDDIRRFIRSG